MLTVRSVYINALRAFSSAAPVQPKNTSTVSDILVSKVMENIYTCVQKWSSWSWLKSQCSLCVELLLCVSVESESFTEKSTVQQHQATQTRRLLQLNEMK